MGIDKESDFEALQCRLDECKARLNLTTSRWLGIHSTILEMMSIQPEGEEMSRKLYNYYVTLDRFSKLQSDGEWCRSLIETGIPRVLILEAWNRVDELRRASADQFRQKMEDDNRE